MRPPFVRKIQDVTSGVNALELVEKSRSTYFPYDSADGEVRAWEKLADHIGRQGVSLDPLEHGDAIPSDKEKGEEL